MKVQKVFTYSLIVFLFTIILSCKTDKTPIGVEEEAPCWNKKLVIHDYEYLKNQFFFVDTFYTNYFEKGYNEDLSLWEFQVENLLRNLEVYISTPYSSSSVIQGVAAIKPGKYTGLTKSSYDTIVNVSGKVHKNFYEKIQENHDFNYYFSATSAI